MNIDIEKVIANSFSLDDIKITEDLSLLILEKAFQLIPLNILDESHKMIIQEIISSFAEKILFNDREEEVD